MKSDKFLENLPTVLDILSNKKHQESFVSNMEYLNKSFDSFAEWMITYLAWSELGNEEDCKQFYWNLEEED